MLKKVIPSLKKLYYDHNSVTEESVTINIKRILYASTFALFLDVITVFTFLNLSSNDEGWEKMIVLAHIAMAGLMLIVFLLSLLLSRQMLPKKLAYPLQYIAFISVLALGIAATTIDQRVTSNITPYIMACLLSATVILIRPVYSMLMFMGSYFTLFFFIEMTSTSIETLWSNRVNAMTVMAISFLISVLMWRNNYIHIRQKRHIDAQQIQLKKINRELNQMAYYDSLTGLHNRRHFDRVIKKEISRMQRKDYSSCLVMLDIDYFKIANDTYGHPAGDKLLIQISNLLSRNIRKYDTLCRLGGEEFIILLPQATLDDGLAAAENLRKLIDAYRFTADKEPVHLTASFGVALLNPSEDPALINQYNIVDHALYLAKQSGRNCVKTWTEKAS